jgi:DNA invertase Pin-like site-specific DNA recombinase
MKIGYARISTQDQNVRLQQDALAAAGCSTVHVERKSGKNTDRPELQKMLVGLRPGDTVVVWKLDRLGCSLSDLMGLVKQLQEKGVDFVSLHDKIDTGSA